MQQHIDNYLEILNNQRFKLWAIVGKDNSKRDSIIDYLTKKKWHQVNVGDELAHLMISDEAEEIPHDIGTKIKDWFNSKPDNLILTNANILYHKGFGKISPIGAFKYNSRSKNCVIFLEEENIIGQRISHGSIGSEEYYDQADYELLKTKIQEIKDDYTPQNTERKKYSAKSELDKNAIGHLFNYTPIKDVVDIDADLKHEDLKKELISSFIISTSLEKQIVEFYENIAGATHKAVKIVGNYGSGKSHLIAFLITSIINKELRSLIKNDKVKKSAFAVNRDYFTVQFELMPGTADLSVWFYKEIEKQLNQKFDITIPSFSANDINHKDNINSIISTIKQHNPEIGLLVVIDEVSDFLSQKQTHQINRDLQFLRVVAQVCQDTDLLLVTSMQEDVYTSPKFKNIAEQETRISERFQNIQIHKENIKKVIAQRIVPKDSRQRTELESKLKTYSEKITEVNSNLEDFVDLFPFTPFLLNLFNELPYFEKRGAIQFAQSELRYVLNEQFPYFFTYDKVYDLFDRNPNLANLEEIYNATQVVKIIENKINTTIEQKYRFDAIKIVKGLVIYSLWSKGESGATAKQLSENLLILPEVEGIKAYQYINVIIKKLRTATDGYYIKVVKNKETGDNYFKFDPKVDGTPIDEIISNEISTITDDQIETELFKQINEILSLEPYNSTPNVFIDECIWQSVKSFRKGYVVYAKQGIEFNALTDRDYAIVFTSPFRKEKTPEIAENQLTIKIVLKEQENVEAVKRIAAIRQLIDKKRRTAEMARKLTEAVSGSREKNTPGIKYRLARWIRTSSECTFAGKKISIQTTIGKETDNLAEIFDELKTKLFDKGFNELYPEHPKYSMQLTSTNCNSVLTPIAQDITTGDFTNITIQRREFLKSLNLFNDKNYPEINNSIPAVNILKVITKNGKKVTDIERELVRMLADKPYGLEPDVIYLILVLLATEGKIAFKVKAETIDLSNIKEKFRNLNQFETIKYAVKKEDFSFDFANRLINSLGLNGAKIKQDKTRNDIFREYKERVNEILLDFSNTQKLIATLQAKPNLYIDINQIEQEYKNCLVIDWSKLQLDHYTHFANIRDIEPLLPDMEKAIAKVIQIHDALQKYLRDIHEGISYMEKAIELLLKNNAYLDNKQLNSTLDDYFKSSKDILKDLTKFFDLAHNRTLKGKIDEFKKAYINEFYYPAHEKTVGRKQNWNALREVEQHEVFSKIQQVAQIDYVGIGEFHKQIDKWNNILNTACEHIDLDRMQQVPFCANCNFMNTDKDYSYIKKEIEKRDDFLDRTYETFVNNVISNITQNISKIDIIDIPQEHKQQINVIVESKKLPDLLSPMLISSINALFKKVQIKEFSKDKVFKTLMPEDKLYTLEEIRKNWYNLEEELKGMDNESEIRIKIV